MTRIIAGRAGSLRLDVPDGPTRPTSERVREAMFSAIENLVTLDGSTVLDLYAGSGALGFEAASRGARSVVFVDSSKKAQRALTSNAARVSAALGQDVLFQVVESPAASYLRKMVPGETFTLVVLDPPYDVSADDVVECLLGLQPALTADSVVVVERAKKSGEPDWPNGFEVIKKKTYGDTVVFYLRYLR